MVCPQWVCHCQSANTECNEFLPCTESSGSENPLQTQYSEPLDEPALATAVFLVILSASSQLRYDRESGVLARSNRTGPDGPVLAAGINTLLHQLTPNNKQACTSLHRH